MNIQPTLENDLVRIRPMEETDFEPLYEVAKDPHIWSQHHVKRYQPNIFKNFFEDSMKSGGALIIIDNSTDEIIGSTRFRLLDGFPNGVEIGWTFLATKYWGGKYNKSVKQSMITYAHQFVDQVILYVNKYNLRSQKAAIKVGGVKISDVESKDIPRKDKDTLIFVIKKE